MNQLSDNPLTTTTLDANTTSTSPESIDLLAYMNTLMNGIAKLDYKFDNMLSHVGTMKEDMQSQLNAMKVSISKMNGRRRPFDDDDVDDADNESFK